MATLLTPLVLLLACKASEGFSQVHDITQSLVDEGLPLYFNWCDATENGCSPHKVQAYGWCVAYAWTETFETQLFRASGGRKKKAQHMSMTPYLTCKQQLLNDTKKSVGSISDFTAKFGSWDVSEWPEDGLLDMCLDPEQMATEKIEDSEAWGKAQKLKKWYTVEDGWDFDNDVCLVKKFAFPPETYSTKITRKPELLKPGDIPYYGTYEDCRRNYYQTRPVGKWCSCSYGTKHARQTTRGGELAVHNLVPKNSTDIAKMLHEWGPWWNHVPAPFAVSLTDRASPYKKCSKNSANHMIAVVGWDARPGGQPSWIVRDSIGKLPDFAYIEMDGSCGNGDLQGFGRLNHNGFLAFQFEGKHNPSLPPSLYKSAADPAHRSYLDPALVSELADEIFL